jgi:hypothetical protein
VILVAGVGFVLLTNNLLIFTPFLVAEGLLYSFSGNTFEIYADFSAGTVERRSHDLLNLVQFHTAVKIADIDKICVVGRYSGERHVADRLVILLKDQSRTALCSASYSSDCGCWRMWWGRNLIPSRNRNRQVCRIVLSCRER